MEILIVVGFLALLLIIFTGGGILGWVLKGIGSIFELLLDGWGSCMSVVLWLVIILLCICAFAM